MADENKTEVAAADAESHEVQLGDESAVLYKAVEDVRKAVAGLGESVAALTKNLEDALTAVVAKQAEGADALAAEVTELKAWNAKAEEFFGEQAKAIAGLYERKGR